MNSCCLGRLLLYSLPVGISFCILLVMRLTQKIKDILLIQFQSKPESWNCLAKDSQCWTWGRCRATSSAVVKWKIWKVRRFFKTCTNLRTESYPHVVLLPFEKKKIFVLALFVNLIIHAYSFTPFSSKWIAHFCFRLCVCWDIAFIFHKILNNPQNLEYFFHFNLWQECGRTSLLMNIRMLKMNKEDFKKWKDFLKMITACS